MRSESLARFIGNVQGMGAQDGTRWRAPPMMKWRREHPPPPHVVFEFRPYDQLVGRFSSSIPSSAVLIVPPVSAGANGKSQANGGVLRSTCGDAGCGSTRLRHGL